MGINFWRSSLCAQVAGNRVLAAQSLDLRDNFTRRFAVLAGGCYEDTDNRDPTPQKVTRTRVSLLCHLGINIVGLRERSTICQTHTVSIYNREDPTESSSNGPHVPSRCLRNVVAEGRGPLPLLTTAKIPRRERVRKVSVFNR